MAALMDSGEVDGKGWGGVGKECVGVWWMSVGVGVACGKGKG